MRTIGPDRRSKWPLPRADRRSRRISRLILLGFPLTLLWPLAINGGPLLFFDSLIYVDQGRSAMEGLGQLLSTGLSGEQEREGSFEAAASAASFIRSLAWSTFAFITSLTPLGLAGPVVLQALLVAALIMVFLGPAVPSAGPMFLVALGALALLTSLPWFASFLMPDLQAAIVILCGLMLARTWPRGEPGVLALSLLALVMTFAILSHYGHLPLAMVVALAVLLALGHGRRLTIPLALTAIVPILLAAGLNMIASRVAFDTVDVAPKRLPILLARSIEDGPARWYLEAACPEAGYAICPMVARLPSTAGGFLWGPDSLRARSTPEELEAIRAEELSILWGAFRAYPLQQGWSFLGNGVRQLFNFGLADFRWGTTSPGEDGRPEANIRAMTDRTGLDAMEKVQVAVVALSALGILGFALRDRLSATPDERALLFVVMIGLLANAFIFGGLSAPADRYQARVIWLVPLLALLFLLNRRASRLQ